MDKQEIKKEINEIEDKITNTAKSVWEKTKSIGKAFKREAEETKLAAKILIEITRGHEVSDEQIKFLKEQSIDFGKALAIIGLQAIPGSSVAIVALEKVGQKHGFTVFPKDQIDPMIEKEKEHEITKEA